MKKNYHSEFKLLYGAVFLLTILLLPVSCGLLAGQDGRGGISITLPGGMSGGARGIKLDQLIINDMRYELTFTGPGASQNKTGKATETITVFLEPGTWNVEIIASYPEPFESPEFPNGDGINWVKAGTGKKTVNIKAGQVNSEIILIEMDNDFLKPGKPNYGAEPVRLWANMLSQNSNNNYCIGAIEKEPLMTPDGYNYKWYSMELKEGIWKEISGAAKEELSLEDFVKDDPVSGDIIGTLSTETMYFYCEITHEFGTGADIQRISGTTVPIGIYPPNAQGLQDWINDAVDGEYISLPTSSLNAFNFEINKTITVDKDVTLNTVFGAGTVFNWPISTPGTIEGNMFIVEKGKLTLLGGESSTLTLNGENGDLSNSLILVKSGGTLEIGEKGEGFLNNVILCKNKADKGGAVYVNTGGRFNMYNGEISENEADNGGGVYVNINGEFAMMGGSIESNIAANYGGGVYIAYNGAFNKQGGVIYGIEQPGTINLESNKADNGIGSGNAAYRELNQKYRDTTIGENETLNSIEDIGWE